MALQQTLPDPTEVLAAQRAAEAEVFMAADTFGAALHASPEFAALVEAGDALKTDAEANAAIEAFGRRQAALGMQAMFDTLDDAQRTELERLQAAMLACPSVAAQADFQAVCVETAGVISGQIEIDFAANSRPGGCCG